MSFLSRILGRGSSSLTESDYAARRSETDLVIDVRTPGEFSAGHLTGAHNIDVNSADFSERVKALELDKEQPVYLYCRSGGRSGRAADILRSSGYSKAINIGGYDALVRAGAPSGD